MSGLFIESLNTPGFAGTRRPAPTVSTVVDLAPFIYSQASHKIAAGDMVVIRPDGPLPIFQGARFTHAQIMLRDGRTLISGGAVDNVAANITTKCDIYNPATKAWSATGSMSNIRRLHSMVQLQNGQILAGSGQEVTIALTTCELYDQNRGTWVATGSLNTARSRITMITLPNGKVLAAGGQDLGGLKLTSCELYDPATGTWSFTGPLNVGRQTYGIVLLQNGKVLIVGGSSAIAGEPSCEIFDPATGTWSTTGLLTTGRAALGCVLLNNGKVLAVGGSAASVFSSCELYDPATGTWSATGSMTGSRQMHAAVLLASGKVLAAGGFTTTGGNQALATCEVYDPALGTWASTGSLISARYSHAASILSDGTVLVSGGDNTNSTTALVSANALPSCELYDPATGIWNSRVVYMPAATSVSSAVNWHDQSNNINKSMIVRVAGASSGSWRLEPRYRMSNWSNPAGVNTTFANSIQNNASLTNQGLQASPNVNWDRALFPFIAITDLVVPATGCRVEVSILNVVRPQ